MAAQAADTRRARKQGETYGIQLLNAVNAKEGIDSRLTINAAFGLFTLLDLFTAAVRPPPTSSSVPGPLAPRPERAAASGHCLERRTRPA